MDNKKNDLDVKRNDLIASGLKSTFGAVPYLGPIISEMVDNLIPNQRIDRIASLLKKLEAKIDPKEKAKVEAKILKEKSVDLMEDGFLQAARALSEERIEYIASLLKNGLTDEDLEEIAYKRLLSLLDELDDLEVLILKSYFGNIKQQQEFQVKHQKVLRAPIVTHGSSQEKVDKQAIYEAHKMNLTRLGLLKPYFKIPQRGEQPEFSQETGMMKAQGYRITNLGRLLLRSIDQDQED